MCTEIWLPGTSWSTAIWCAKCQTLASRATCRMILLTPPTPAPWYVPLTRFCLAQHPLCLPGTCCQLNLGERCWTYALEVLPWVEASQEGSHHVGLWPRDPGCGCHPSSSFPSFFFLPFMTFLLPSSPKLLSALGILQIRLFPLLHGGKVHGGVPGETGKRWQGDHSISRRHSDSVLTRLPPARQVWSAFLCWKLVPGIN